MRSWLLATCLLALVALNSSGRAAETPADTGKICAVTATPPARPGESLSTSAAHAVQALHCQPGDILEMTYAEGDPTPVMAQLCDFGRQINVYNAPPRFAQVGITSELVCSLAATRRTHR